MKKIYLFILMLITIPSISLATSLPKFPMAFYGNVTINGKNAPEGTIIRAYYGNNLAGTSTVDSSGSYGYIDSIAKKLLVSEGSGKITFTFQSSSILSNKETSGKNSISHLSFEEGLVVNKNLDFSYQNSSGGSSGGGGSGGSSSSSSKTNTTPTVSNLSSQVAPGTNVVVNTKNVQHSFNFKGITKLGSKGESTKELQKVLIEKGYLSGVADGSFGQMTLSAVKKFQEANGLVADGIVGPALNSILNKTINSVVTTIPTINNNKLINIKSVLRFGSKGNEVKEIQNKLVEKGFLSAIPNGNFGPATLKAIKSFQSANGLKPDGIVGTNTLNLINL